MRLLLLLLIILLFGYTVFQILRTRKDIRIGEELAAHTVPFSRSLPNSSLRILFVGDSTAFGVGSSAPEHSLAGMVGEKYSHAEIVNISVNGAKASDTILQLNTVDDKSFDLIMVHVGGNDVVRFTKYDAFAKDIIRVIDLATNKGTRVLVTSTGNVGTAPLLPSVTHWIFEARTRKIREIMISAVVETDTTTVRYTDLFRERPEDPFAQNPSLYYAADSFHPSDVGYQDWFLFIEKELDVFFKEHS